MRTYKYIPFLIALILHILPFLLVLRNFNVQTIAIKSSSGPKRIDLTSFTSPRFLSTSTQKTAVQPIKNVGHSPTVQMNQMDTTGSTLTSNSELQFIVYIEPSYPVIARQNGNEGKVKIKARYNQEGNITKIEIVETSGLRMLEGAVVKAAKEWKVNTSTEGSFEKTFQFKLNKSFQD